MVTGSFRRGGVAGLTYGGLGTEQGCDLHLWWGQHRAMGSSRGICRRPERRSAAGASLFLSCATAPFVATATSATSSYLFNKSSLLSYSPLEILGILLEPSIYNLSRYLAKTRFPSGRVGLLPACLCV